MERLDRNLTSVLSKVEESESVGVVNRHSTAERKDTYY